MSRRYPRSRSKPEEIAEDKNSTVDKGSSLKVQASVKREEYPNAEEKNCNCCGHLRHFCGVDFWLGGGAANAAPQVNQVSASDEVDLTHGELYQALADSPLEKKDEYLNGEAVTTFTADNGLSITLPKPSSGKGLQPGGGKSPGGGHSVKPYLSGKINKKGEPVIYLSQKDQRRIAKVGKISAVGIFAILGPVGKAAKFVSAALGAVTAEFISNHGKCKNGKSLRITGTPGGDAIKEIKCV